MIITEGLSKSFDHFLAVDKVNLSVGSGEILALLGPNGAGKTTTIRMLSSILLPSEGRALVANYNVVEQAAQVRASVGVLTENHGLYNRMPSGEYLDFFGQIYNLNQASRKARVHQLMEQFGLTEYINKPIGEFSKGMRQKLALARALFHNPKVLLLDEPTSAMDPESARLVRDSIRTLRSEERTIAICTHNLVEAEELADQIAIIQHGRIVVHGSTNELKRRLLGSEEYEIVLAKPLNGFKPVLPDGTSFASIGPNWIRFYIEDPQEQNPILLRKLLEQGLEVISLKEIPRNLEQVYLQAISTIKLDEATDVE
jgi:ABC-2 type transport system ATP-binding protein